MGARPLEVCKIPSGFRAMVGPFGRQRNLHATLKGEIPGSSHPEVLQLVPNTHDPRIEHQQDLVITSVIEISQGPKFGGKWTQHALCTGWPVAKLRRYDVCFIVESLKPTTRTSSCNDYDSLRKGRCNVRFCSGWIKEMVLGNDAALRRLGTATGAFATLAQRALCGGRDRVPGCALEDEF